MEERKEKGRVQQQTSESHERVVQRTSEKTAGRRGREERRHTRKRDEALLGEPMNGTGGRRRSERERETEERENEKRDKGREREGEWVINDCNGNILRQRQFDWCESLSLERTPNLLIMELHQVFSRKHPPVYTRTQTDRQDTQTNLSPPAVVSISQRQT